LTIKTSAGEPMHNFYDWLGCHPYDSFGPGGPSTEDNLAVDIDFVQSELNKNGIGHKPQIITEWGHLQLWLLEWTCH
jgi:hypothetical protein